MSRNSERASAGRQRWQWREGKVDRGADHFELRYGDPNEDGGGDDWPAVALIGPPNRHRTFPVEFVPARNGEAPPRDILAAVKRDLDFYLTDVGRPDPWIHAQYHCGTMANAISHVHWWFHTNNRSRTHSPSEGVRQSRARATSRSASLGRTADIPARRRRVGTTVVAIGDLHGHYPALEQLLDHLRAERNLFEDRDPDRLRPGVTLVFTGDYIDRGDHGLAIIEKLKTLAAINPRQVITLLGNHELLALEAYDEVKRLSKRSDASEALSEYRTTCHGGNGGDRFLAEFGPDAGAALRNYVARMARSGDIGSWMRALAPCFETTVAGKKILFTHADLTERLRNRGVLDRYLDELARHRHTGTDDAGGTAVKYGAELFMSSHSIFWDRSFGDELKRADQRSIDEICRSVGVDYLVTGHTYHNAITDYGKRIFDIDVAMTPKCGGNTPQALLIRSDGIMGVGVDGSETRFVRW